MNISISGLLHKAFATETVDSIPGQVTSTNIITSIYSISAFPGRYAQQQQQQN